MTFDDSAFNKPISPKNTCYLLLWVIFEPFLLERYSNSLNKKQAAIKFFKACPVIILITFVCYLVTCFILIAFDIPNLFPSEYRAEFVENYRVLIDFDKKFNFAILYNIKFSILLLILGLTVVFALVLFFGLAGGISLGVALIFFVAFDIALTLGFAGAFSNGLILGLALGNVSAFIGIVNLIVGISLVKVSFVGISKAIAIGLAGGLGWCFSYYRIYFYPFHLIRSLFSFNFYNSPL